jgi:xanthine dehydrogenase small subunit
MEIAAFLGKDRGMRNTIFTNVNGRDVTIADAPPHGMALAWLRAAGWLSVKEGCGEGDCGACTVALGTPRDGTLQWREVASCLLFLPMLDGCALLTVEGLKGPGGGAHPVQTAMADGFGTQCGFCSPGITMALFAMAHRPARDDDAILDGLAGNLCRCTGYRPIIEIARALPAASPDAADAALAAQLQAKTALPLQYRADGIDFFAPACLADALAFRAAHPTAWLLAGGTDLGLTVTKRHERPDAVLSLARLPELTAIALRPDGVTIGAAVPYSDVLRVLAERHPHFAALVRRIGATQIRHQGTLGGNLGTASPIGDTIPALIALGAAIEVAGSAGRRVIAAEHFVTGYRATALADDELIVAIDLPDLGAGDVFRAYKIAKRIDQDISTVSAAFRLSLRNGRVAALRAAFGGVAATPVRAKGVEAALAGQPWSAESIAAARRAVADDIAPQSDLRGSAAYRRRLAANLIERLWRETTAPAGVPMTLEEV